MISRLSNSFSHLVIFRNTQGLSHTFAEKWLLLMSPLPLWGVQFFLLLSWEKYFAIDVLSRGEIKDQATDFQRKFAKTNYTILIFHMDKPVWLWREDFVRRILRASFAVSLTSLHRVMGDCHGKK